LADIGNAVAFLLGISGFETLISVLAVLTILLMSGLRDRYLNLTRKKSE